MRVLGIDPASSCGWAHSCGKHGVWKLTADTDRHGGARLNRLRLYLYQEKRLRGIDLIAAEDAGFGSRNPHVEALHNELRGIIKLCAFEFEIPVLLFKPKEIKLWLTGRGNCGKDVMIHHVRERFGIVADDDNVADAVAIMEMAKTKWSEGYRGKKR